ncbi:NUDIX domain-containing protein [bacterium]|nr:NUDIX domain-containing protein [bacterium]
MEDELTANPWTVKQRTTAYENPWIRVEHNEVLNPSGRDGIYGVVRFKNWAIGILPIDDEGYTWVVGQYRFPLGEYSWEIPEGGGKLGVDPLASAQRELLEECGLKAERWTLIQTMSLSNSVSDERALIYLAEGLSQHEAEPEETEQLQIRRIPFSELYAGVLEGSVHDSLTVAAALRYRLLQLEAVQGPEKV